MNDGPHDELIGKVAALITFLGAWAYCINGYGFLFGFGLGWLPAAILAAIVGGLMMFFWRWAVGLIALYALVLAVAVLWH